MQSFSTHARTIAIWVFGLIGSGFFGSVLGNYLTGSNGEFQGLIAGMCLFACIRLWKKEHHNN